MMSAAPHSFRPGSLRKRAINNRLFGRRQIHTSVIVDGTSYRLELREVPLVGTLLDVGFPVCVTSSKHVAGGGALVYATRLDSPEASTSASGYRLGRTSRRRPKSLE